MSDSDDELLSNSVFTFPNDGSTIMSARGPDININFALPRTLAPPRYAESNYERQRNKRDMSPMSVASACDARFRAFNNSYYPGAMSSMRSTYNGRSGSPMSTRTCDTNTTLTATDIAQALLNPKFNKRDARIINKAISKWKEIDKYKRIEKRRKQRIFLQRTKRLSYDSGEQASLSSSSEDNRSTKTTCYRKNMSSCRSTKTDISDFRRTIQDSNIYKDCTDNFRHNYSRNFLNRPALSSTLMSINSARNMNKNFHEPKNSGVFVFGNQSNFQTQKERFQNGFLLPSQRFDKSIATSTIPETQRHHVEDTDSDDNIFSVNNNKNKTLPKRKRSMDEDNADLVGNKRPRVVSPCENNTEASRAEEIENTNMLTKSNDFVFAKPSLPIRKTVKEKLISQSAPPLPEIVVSELTEKQPINKEIAKDNEEIPHNITQSTDVSMRPSFIKRKLFTQKLDVAENNNVSSDNLAANSPQGSIYSAIQKEKHKARKLVTNQSCLNREIQDDSNLLELIHKIVPPNSMNITTQSNKTEIQSTKNKSNNSDKWDISSIISMKNNEDDCSDTFTDEDVFNGDNNNTVKEGPSEKKTKSNVQKNNKKTSNLEKVPSKDKLLVSKNVPNKDKDPISEKVANNLSESNELARKVNLPISGKVTSRDKPPESDEVARKDKLPTFEKPLPVFTKPDTVAALKNHAMTCKVVVQNMPIRALNGPGIKNYINRFWETDSESDVECLTAKRKERENNNGFIRPQEKVPPQLQGVAEIIKKPTAIADASIISMAETTQRFNATSFKIKSHRSLKPKKFCDDNKENTIKSYFDPLNKKQKSNELIQTDAKKCVDKIETQKNNMNTTKKQREIKMTPTKLSKTPPKTKQNKKNIEVENNNHTMKKQREIKLNPTKILKTPPKVKQNKKNVETENTDQARGQKELAKRQEPTKEQANKQETAKPQTKKQETAKAQPKKQESAKPQAKKQETVKAQAKKREIAKIIDKKPQNKNKDIATAKKSESKTTKDTKTPPKTKPKENEVPKTRENSIKSRNKKILLEDSSLTNSTLEKDNSRITRPMRSCRLNSSTNSSNGSFNITMTLRPRKTSSKVKCISLSCSRMNERAI